VTVPRKNDSRSREDIEKERGNSCFKAGDFLGAVRCYTNCIGQNPSNHLLWSNRAMAHLKLKEFRKAAEDSAAALKLNPKHTKSWVRRGLARNQLGFHSGALYDFQRARELDPSNKQILVELRKSKELRKAAIRHCPKRHIPVLEIADEMKKSSQANVMKVVDKPTSDNRALSATNKAKIEEAIVNTEKEKKAEVVKVMEDKPAQKPKTTTATKPRGGFGQIQMTPPKTAYEFEKVWNHLKQDSKKFNDYLMLIKPANFVKIFKHSLNDDILSSIIQSVDQFMLSENEVQAFEVLRGLCKTERFQVTMMLLPKKDKEAVASIFNKLDLSKKSGSSFRDFEAVEAKYISTSKK